MYKLATLHDLVEYLLTLPNQNMSIKETIKTIRLDLINNNIELVGNNNE